MKNYKVVASWHDGKNIRQVVGTYSTIEKARDAQAKAVNQIPLSALEEHITISIEKINHRVN